jgi:Pyruvate kinase, barrel domain
MSISQSSTIPILAGGYINLDTIQQKTVISNRQCKIITTIGPACWETTQLESLMNNGMNTALLDMSHGNKNIHIDIIQRIKQARTNVNRNIGKIKVVDFFCCSFLATNQKENRFLFFPFPVRLLRVLYL